MTNYCLYYLCKDFNSFWKTCKNKEHRKHPNIFSVSGLSDNKATANRFAVHFSNIQKTLQYLSGVFCIFEKWLDYSICCGTFVTYLVAIIQFHVITVKLSV